VQQFDPPDLAMVPTFRRLLQLWREQRLWVAIALGCAFAYTTLSLTIPVLIERAIDRAIVPGDTSQLWPYAAAIMGFSVARFAVNFTRRSSTARIGVHIEARMRELLYDSYLTFPRGFFDRHSTGQVVSRATNDLYPVRYFIGWGMIQGAQSAMMIVGAGIVLTLVDPRLALYTGLTLPLIGLLAWLFAHRVMPISRLVQTRKGDVTEAADEAVVGIEMVQAFGREDDVRNRFGDKAGEVRNVVLRQAGIEARHLPGLYYLPGLSIAVVVFFGGRAVIAGDLSIGQFVLFNTILLQLAWPLESLGWITNLAQRALASAGRSFAWIDHVDRLAETDDPATLPAGPQPIVFEDVHFAYADEDEVLSGFDLEVPAGQIVAICGATGSGKTSVLNLLPRFYDPTSGRLLLGGVDVRRLGLADLRAAVSVVTQKPVLFSVPLRDNLLIGRPDAVWHEVLAASRAAGVDDFVDDLPDGYDTMIGERGVNLSGGQRQRVALARALLRAGGVIVMDDPLSAVDTTTERDLLETIRPALTGRTVVIATQRLSTVALADRAVVIRDGRVVEAGAPRELVTQGGEFAALFGDETIAA
jgi:ABC-type multidrug transport system fused ATPase/permease subunit